METLPEVFIVESLKFDDEECNRLEGRMISNILNLNDKYGGCYYYIRTKKEFMEVLKIFGQSRCRYLHLSCHGRPDSMATTLDVVPFDELGLIIRPYLRNKRVFVSACEMVNEQLARTLLLGTDCYSVIGPGVPVRFSDAAIIWSAFYHLMFTHDPFQMKMGELKNCTIQISSLFGIPMRYYSSSHRYGYKLIVDTCDRVSRSSYRRSS